MVGEKMKTRYKIPIVIALLFVIIWPQMPHIIWIACEILPDCNTETSHASGIGLPWISINTNLFDDLSEGMDGFLMLGVSFSLMAFLAIWRIKTKPMFKIIIPCVVFFTLVFISLWLEYGIVCNDHVVEHLRKYSNLFDGNTTKETFAIHAIGYPFGVHELNVKECVDYVFANSESRE